MIQPSATLRRVGLVFAAILLFALIQQAFQAIWTAQDEGGTVATGLSNYFAFFTILTNGGVMLALVLPVLVPRSRLGRFFAQVKTHTSLAINLLLVGLAYHILLSGLSDPKSWHKASDVVVHYLAPPGFLLYWWFACPKQQVRWAFLFTTLIYPISYLIYVLIRGELVGRYPYFFLDVGLQGWGVTLLFVLGLMVGLLAIGAVVIGLGRLRKF